MSGKEASEFDIRGLELKLDHTNAVILFLYEFKLLFGTVFATLYFMGLLLLLGMLFSFLRGRSCLLLGFCMRLASWGTLPASFL